MSTSDMTCGAMHVLILLTIYVHMQTWNYLPIMNAHGKTTSGRMEVKLDGDIILGGLFPMHEKGHQGGQLCGEIKEEKGIQRMEAMLYAIDRINADNNLLPHIKLGAHILDTCLRDTYALEQSLDFIKPHMNTLDVTEFRCSDGKSPNYTPAKPVAGVIGAAASPVSIMVANILRLFKIPQISYASTGIELSDKSRFEYFSRVVPPDTYQAQALVDVVSKFGWSYVVTLADEGNYGEKGIAAFEEIAKSEGICIARSLKIPRDISDDVFKEILLEFMKYSKARIVVMFVNEDNCRRLLTASRILGLTSHFYWIASDSWGSKLYPVEQQEWAAEGTVTILPQTEELPGFNVYLAKLKPETNTRNPWFVEFWEKHFHCTFNANMSVHRRTCSGRERISRETAELLQEGLVPFVVDAVYSMAHALSNMHKDKCKGKSYVCGDMLPIAGSDLLSYIRNVSFTGITGNHVRFNQNGDALGRYTVYQYQKLEGNKYDYIVIGNWTHGYGWNPLNLDLGRVQWKNGTYNVPRSVCSEACAPGYVRSSKGPNTCCWACIKCTDYEILLDEYSCSECANGSIPNENKTTCLPLPVLHMSIDSPWAMVPVIFSSAGILLIVLTIAVFIKYNKTPVIMASGRELCYVLLFGLAFCYSMTFVMVTRPTLFTCTLLRIGLGMSLSICYAALFTKTNRISRIFNRGIKAMVKRPSYTSPRSQLVICGCLVSVQVMGALTWLGMDAPGTAYAYPDRRTVILRCKSTNFAIVMSLVYNMILIILCTVYAFKTRKIPENYNEAKYIAFTMYSTCIVWLAFIPIYFGTKNDYKVQITALCMCLNISAAVAFGCMFAPKMYIVLCQPHKNVRQSVGIAAALNPQRTSAGLALLIAQTTVKAAESARKHEMETNKSPESQPDLDSIRDLDSCASNPDTSEPETHL